MTKPKAVNVRRDPSGFLASPNIAVFGMTDESGAAIVWLQSEQSSITAAICPHDKALDRAPVSTSEADALPIAIAEPINVAATTGKTEMCSAIFMLFAFSEDFASHLFIRRGRLGSLGCLMVEALHFLLERFPVHRT